MKLNIIVIFICAAGLVASCSNDDDNSVNVVTVSGTKHDMNKGVYLSDCFTNDGINGERHLISVQRKELFQQISIFRDDLSCLSVPESSDLSAEITIESVAAITGWEDEAFNNVDAPNADDGSLLNDTESTTLLRAVVTGRTGTEFSTPIKAEFNLFYIVDDSSDRILFYRHSRAEDINNLKALKSTQFPVLIKQFIETVEL